MVSHGCHPTGDVPTVPPPQVLSLGLVAVGLYARLLKQAEAVAAACLALDPALLLLLLGVLVFLVTFCGCVGALRENICLLQAVRVPRRGSPRRGSPSRVSLGWEDASGCIWSPWGRGRPHKEDPVPIWRMLSPWGSCCPYREDAVPMWRSVSQWGGHCPHLGDDVPMGKLLSSLGSSHGEAAVPTWRSLSPWGSGRPHEEDTVPTSRWPSPCEGGDPRGEVATPQADTIP